MRVSTMLFAALVMTASSAFAGEPAVEYRNALSFALPSESTLVSYRRLVRPNLALLASVGFVTGEISTVGGTGSPATDQDSSAVEVGFGVRRYLRAGDFRPLLELRASYSTFDTSICSSSLDRSSVSAAGGVEYFFTRRFSVEGTVGAAYARQDYGCNTVPGQDVTVQFDGFNTVRSAIGINFYF